MERVESRHLSATGRDEVNVNLSRGATLLWPNSGYAPSTSLDGLQFVENDIVQTLRNKEKETEERLEKSPLHHSLKELSI